MRRAARLRVVLGSELGGLDQGTIDDQQDAAGLLGSADVLCKMTALRATTNASGM